MEALYNYVFWYNHHEGVWYAIDRDTQLAFFNGDRKISHYYKSKDVNTLIELLNKPTILKELNEQENNKTA